MQQLIAKCKADRACKTTAELALATAEARLAKVDTLVWGFPLTIEGPRCASASCKKLALLRIVPISRLDMLKRNLVC